MSLLKRFDNDLKAKGFNLRERTNVYTGLIMWTAAPVVAIRYGLFPDAPLLLLVKLSHGDALCLLV